MKRFAADLTISAAISCVLLLQLGGLATEASLSTKIAIVIVLVAAGPILGIAALAGGAFALTKALKRRHMGLVLGPPLVLLLAPVLSILLLKRDAQSIEALIVEPSSTPTAIPHTVILNRCDQICLAILASGRFEVFHNGTVRRLLSGDQCLATAALANSALSFAEVGYANLCASSEFASPSLPALRIDDHSFSNKTQFDIASSSFRGSVYELMERDAAGERLLSRWISGKVKSRTPWPLLFVAQYMGVRFEQSVGSQFLYTDFYNAALGLALTGNPKPGTSSNQALLDWTRRILPQTSDKESALRLMTNLARKVGPDAAAPLMMEMIRDKHVTNVQRGVSLMGAIPPQDRAIAIPELIALSHDQNVERAKLGIEGLGHLATQDLVALKEQIVDLINSPDKQVASAALKAVGDLDGSDCSFLKLEIAEIALDDSFSKQDQPMLSSLMHAMECVQEAFPADIQTRARKRLLDDVTLDRGQIWMTLRLMANANPAGRDEAARIVLALQSPRFERTVEAVRIEAEYALNFRPRNPWNIQEIDQLFARTEQIPAAGLQAYLNALAQQVRTFEEQEPRLREILDKRLSDAEESGDSEAERQIRAVQHRYNLD